MRKGFFYSEEVRGVVLGDKNALLAEIDEAVEKASAKPRMRTVYEVRVSVRYERGHYTVPIPDELGERYFEALERRNKFTWDKPEYKKLDLKVECLQKEIESVIENRMSRRLTEDESANIYSREVPYCSVEFQVGNSGMSIYKSKKVLSAFRKRVKGTPATCVSTVVLKPKKFDLKPVAAKMEAIEYELLQKVKQRGWFTDGCIAIKGEPPKGTAIKGAAGANLKVLGMEYEKTHPAELLYYYMCNPDVGTGVSKDPIPQLGVNGNYFYSNMVLFKTGENYVSFVQGKFRAIANRFPDAEYRINRNARMLVAYRNKKPMAIVMKVRGNEPAAKKFPQLQSEPSMKAEAREARFLKRKALEL
ncbi:MAG: hypothetical protein V3V88_01060 [Dehalococcoidia bacterium]